MISFPFNPRSRLTLIGQRHFDPLLVKRERWFEGPESLSKKKVLEKNLFRNFFLNDCSNFKLKKYIFLVLEYTDLVWFNVRRCFSVTIISQDPLSLTVHLLFHFSDKTIQIKNANLVKKSWNVGPGANTGQFHRC